jgi:superfamily II DNA or RNA helicase
MDEDGTAELFKYFGSPVYQYPISRAIKEKHLTEYYYYPILVDLTDDEAKEYCEITQKISKVSQFDADGDFSETLKNLLIRRSRLVGSARNKIPKLKEVIQGLDSRRFEKALIYCGDGSTESDVSNESIRNIDSVTTMLSQMEYRVARFTCGESRSRRDTIINQLKTDKIDAIVAIRCMDEGIDIPSAALGFILASSTNSRQIVQRRGRLLRKAEGKKFAHIYDFIIRPPVMTEYANDKQAHKTERSLFKRELKRIIEFCDDAINGDQALDELRDLRIKYNLIAYNGTEI